MMNKRFTAGMMACFFIVLTAVVPVLAGAPPEGVTEDRGFVIVDDTITFYEGDETQLILPPSGIDASAIGDYSFMDLEDLKWLCIRGSINSVGERAFAGCTSLKSVILLDGVQSIGTEAFSRCTSLSEVYLPASIEDTGADLFSECTALRHVAFGGTEDEWAQLTDGIGLGIPDSAVMAYEQDVPAADPPEGSPSPAPGASASASASATASASQSASSLPTGRPEQPPHVVLAGLDPADIYAGQGTPDTETVTFMVAYDGLQAGHPYKLEGTLINTDTGDKLLTAAGAAVTADAEFVAMRDPVSGANGAGSASLEFTFNAQDIGSNRVTASVSLLDEMDARVTSCSGLMQPALSVQITQMKLTGRALAASGSRTIPVSSDAAVKETLTYQGLEPNVPYRAVCRILGRGTNTPITSGGKEVQGETVITSVGGSGTAEITVSFSTAGMSGNELTAEVLLYKDGALAGRTAAGSPDQELLVGAVQTSAPSAGASAAAGGSAVAQTDDSASAGHYIWLMLTGAGLIALSVPALRRQKGGDGGK